jgi:hypothetical protein
MTEKMRGKGAPKKEPSRQITGTDTKKSMADKVGGLFREMKSKQREDDMSSLDDPLNRTYDAIDKERDPARSGKLQGLADQMLGMQGKIARGEEYKRGGAVKKMAAGGKASSYEDMTAGSGSGLGRLQKTSIASKTVTQKLKKGGMAKAFEGSAADMAQDKKLAKKYGMSMEDYEKSSVDAKHDKQRSMKGLKMGGKAKMADGGMAAPKKRGNVTTLPVRPPGPKPMPSRGGSMPGGGGFSADRNNPTVLRSFDRRNVPVPGMNDGGMTKMAAGGMSTAQDGMKGALRPKPTAMAMGGYAKGGKAEMHDKGCKCMACGGKAKYAKGGKVTFGSMQPLPGTKTVGPTIRPTVETGASLKKDGMKGQLRAKASGAKATAMMKPLGMTKMAKGGKVRGAGCAQRGTKFIGEV